MDGFIVIINNWQILKASNGNYMMINKYKINKLKRINTPEAKMAIQKETDKSQYCDLTLQEAKQRAYRFNAKTRYEIWVGGLYQYGI